MTRCLVCNGTGRLYVTIIKANGKEEFHSSKCPYCKTALGWMLPLPKPKRFFIKEGR